MRVTTILTLCLVWAWGLYAATYKVGPGQVYTELGQAPWISLSAGDTVLIHWRETPYASKIFLRAQGTKESPVVIRGVPNGNGALPVISGENATTHAQFFGYFDSLWTEHLGLFLIARGPQDDYYTYQPKNIVFEYLELTGVKKENSFTDQYGRVRHYNPFASAIHALLVEGLTVRHCRIHDNGQGIFTNSSDVGNMSTDLLVEYNEIWGNGNADEDGREHNIYAQSLGTVIQYNRLGRLRPGSVGSTLKDRSSGTVIRYNWIEASGRALDLVEAEDGWEITTAREDYHDVYVYGNIFTNYTTKDPYGVNLIHYGFDNSPDIAKEGTLYFYNNTVYIEADQNVYWYMRLFDLGSNKDTVALYNNIINLVAPEGAQTPSELHLMRDYGIANIYEKNWIQQGYMAGADGFAGELNIISEPMTGTAPGFNDPATEDFGLKNDSPCINASAPLPASILENHPLNMEYVPHAGVRERQTVGPALELGAFENNTVTAIGNTGQIPQYFELRQNYPNPFNPATVIRFTLPRRERVSLVVYDVSGNRVRVLLNKVLNRGRHQQRFDAGSLASGTYFYVLKAGNRQQSKKMLLLR